MLGGLDGKDDAGDEEESAATQAEPEGILEFIKERDPLRSDKGFLPSGEVYKITTVMKGKACACMGGLLYYKGPESTSTHTHSMNTFVGISVRGEQQSQ